MSQLSKETNYASPNEMMCKKSALELLFGALF